MAQRKRSSKKTTRVSNNRPTRKTNRSKRTLSKLQYEVIMIALIFVSIFFIISINLSMGGGLGSFFRNIIFGCFGFTGYILPVLLLVFFVYKLFNRANKRLNELSIYIFSIFIFITIFSHIVSVRTEQINLKIDERSIYYPVLANYYSYAKNQHMAGGFIGGLYGDVLLMIFGKWGAYVLVILSSISLIILATNKSFTEVIQVVYKKLLIFFKYLINLLVLIYSWLSEKIKKLAKDFNHNKDYRLNEKNKDNEKESRDFSINDQKDQNFGQPYEEASIEYKSNNFMGKVFGKKKKLSFEEQIAIKEEQRFKEEFEINIVDTGKEEEKIKQDLQEKKLSRQEFENKDIKEVKNIEEVVKASEGIKKPSPATIVEENGKMKIDIKKSESSYQFPPMELLKKSQAKRDFSNEDINKTVKKLESTLESFAVKAKVINVSKGPTVTRYELQPDQGVKVSKIVNLADDLALNLASSGLRIEAPIPGKSAVGIEVPNQEPSMVLLSDILASQEFQRFPSKTAFALGKDIGGKIMITDIAKMPHLLIAGATGSGKSVCINTLIISILYKARPDEVKLMMIDPKVVELSVYNGIPHLLIPVVTDPRKAASALNWAVAEMSDRYNKFADNNVRDIKSYNDKILELQGQGEENSEEEKFERMPHIVIIVDELADLMMVASNEVEDAISRLAQMARAAGIHLIIATQRPSVDVITGLIKANIPSRIAFNVSSGIDSRTILDMNGAEKLLGKGDMLYSPVGLPKPVRIQGAFVTEKEVNNIVSFLKEKQKTSYDEEVISKIEDKVSGGASSDEDLDEYFDDALKLVVEKEKGSASMLQRHFRIGYNRAARILDQLNAAGYVGEEETSKPRKVLITKEELEQILQEDKKDND